MATSRRSRSIRRLEATAIALLALASAGCLDPEPPVLFVPYSAHPSRDPLAVAEAALRQLGFEIAHRDPSRGVLVTRWRVETTLVGTERKRVELRFQHGSLRGFALAVPAQLATGDSWMYHGEDLELRQLVIATLQSRMLAES